jgi:chromosome partitioning protein
MLPVRTVAVINQKGGVGKTTTVANLGAAVAARGHDVCLIDLDPQSHLTLHVGLEPGAAPLSAYDMMTAEHSVAEVALPISPHLWAVPSVIDLAAAEVELVGTVGREQILRDRLHAAPLPYEFVLIDCPPSLGLLTLNALAAADDVIIPLQPHFLALQGLGKLLETVALVQRRINPVLKVSGVVLCLYETGTKLAAEVVADLQQFFAASQNAAAPWAAAKIFQTFIRRNVKLAESPSHGKTIFDYEPHCKGADDYRAMAEEFLAIFAPPGKISRDEGPPGPLRGDTGDKDREKSAEAEEATIATPPHDGSLPNQPATEISRDVACGEPGRTGDTSDEEKGAAIEERKIEEGGDAVVTPASPGDAAPEQPPTDINTEAGDQEQKNGPQG